MKDERILSYRMAEDLSERELEQVSGGCLSTVSITNAHNSYDTSTDLAC